MKTIVCKEKRELGKKAAIEGATAIRTAIKKNGEARIIVATGASQFEMLEQLIQEKNIAWDKVTAFHLDEYVGIKITHPASFRLYLWKRFVSRLPLPLNAFNYVNAEENPGAECVRLGKLISKAPIDICFAGIGENGHLAFNDPPADFKTERPYLVVNLDEACRRQQMGEGWFKTLKDVPKQAISMSIKQIMKSKKIICSVPDSRKAEAVKTCLKEKISPNFPSSILREHANCSLYLDKGSASLLR